MLLLLLTACRQSRFTPPKATSADSLAPDQIQYGSRTYLLRNGVRSTMVEAESTWINQQTHEADLFGLRITFFDSTTGRTESVVTARTGKYDIQNQSLDARGDVVARTTTDKTLRTQHLIYDQIQNLIHSDSAFTVTGSSENMAGTSFETDPAFKTVIVTKPRGREKAVAAKRPAPKKGAGT